MNMRSHDFEQAWLAITKIEAQALLVQFQANSFHRLNQSARETLHRKISREAYPERFENPVTLTLDQIARVVNG